MKVELVQDLACQDIEVLITYANRTHEIERLLTLLQAAGTQIRCSADGYEQMVHASDIYYIESVDKRTFVYCETCIYRTDSRLYQLADLLSGSGFVQISKSCLLNIRMLERIRPLLNSRMEATLINGEHLNVSRKYLSNIRHTLEEGGAGSGKSTNGKKDSC